MNVKLMAVAMLVVLSMASPGAATGERRLTLADYRDKMEGGWVAQMAGVEWGTPTEFKWVNRIVPEDKVPEWKPEMINGAFGNDDLYVEMTFLKTLARDGIDPDIRAAGIDFANSKYDLWCANLNGRINLRAGIAPPDSSHPAYHASPDDIDYQIEADYAGLICPGLPRRVQKLGDVFGRLVNYGDGLYAGVFVGGMYATAFFTEDRLEILEGGLACIPAESRYAKTVRDVIAWWRENPNDWEYAWRKLDAKHGPGAGKFVTTAGIDAALNGASAVIGLLYGNGDLAKTIVIAMRCGYDSDCNPSTAAGVLGTSMGLKRIPETFRSGLKRSTKFNHSDFDFDSMTATCEALARKIVAAEGGRIVRDADGSESFVIPEQKPEARPYVSAAHPGPVAHSAYTDEELARIVGARRLPEPSAFDDTNATRRVQNALDALWPGWTIMTEMRADWRAPMGGGAESCGYFRSAWWTGEKTSQKLGAYLRMRAPKDRPFIALANRSCSVGTMMPAMRMAFCTGWGRETPFELRLDGETAFRGTFSMQTRAFTVPLDKWAGKTVFAELLFWPSNGVPVCLMSPIELLTTGK